MNAGTCALVVAASAGAVAVAAFAPRTTRRAAAPADAHVKAPCSACRGEAPQFEPISGLSVAANAMLQEVHALEWKSGAWGAEEASMLRHWVFMAPGAGVNAEEQALTAGAVLEAAATRLELGVDAPMTDVLSLASELAFDPRPQLRYGAARVLAAAAALAVPDEPQRQALALLAEDPDRSIAALAAEVAR